MIQFKFKVGDIAFIKNYQDVNNHCGLSETDWERMYNRELCIAQTQKNSTHIYYRVQFYCKRPRSWWVTEDALITHNDITSLPDILDYI